VFRVEPESVPVAPGAVAYFTIIGQGSKPGKVHEMIPCVVGNKKGGKEIFQLEPRVMLNVPLLEFSTRALPFVYTYERGVVPSVQVSIHLLFFFGGGLIFLNALPLHVPLFVFRVDPSTSGMAQVCLWRFLLFAILHFRVERMKSRCLVGNPQLSTSRLIHLTVVICNLTL
jgi:hypothetical protein